MMTGEPILMAWSGGKDSSLALAKLRDSDMWEVAGLLTTVTAEYDRIVMHGVRRSLLELQAASLGLPLTIVELPSGVSNAQYETIMETEMREARGRGIRHVAFGDLFLEDVRAYRVAALERLGMEAVFPVWGLPTSQLARDFIARGFRAVLTCVDTEQLPGTFAGREYDLDLLADLPATCDPCGENGEFHTFVFAGPGFARPIPVRPAETVLRDQRFMFCELV